MPSKAKDFISGVKQAGIGGAIGGALLGLPGALGGAALGGMLGYDSEDAAQSQEEANAALTAQKAGDVGKVQDWKEQLRQEAISGADIASQRAEQNYQQLQKAQGQVAGAYDQAAAAAERGGQIASVGARQQAAAALRAAAGTGGSGGAKAAQLATTGAGLGQQVGQTLSDAARAKAAIDLQGKQTAYGLTASTGQAGVEAGAQKIEAAKTKKEAGTAGTDYQQKIRDYNDQIAKIKASKKGGLGGILPDDEVGAAQQIRDLAAAEEDPQVAEWLKKQADAAAKDI